jgi:hypothetical protein
MDDTQSTGQPPLAPVPVPDAAGSTSAADPLESTERPPSGPDAGSPSAADTSATVTSKRRRGSQSTSKTKSSPEERALKKKERALKQKQHDREFLIKYMAFMNRYQDYIDAKEELVRNYRGLGCSWTPDPKKE